jgi:biliverdin reductase
MVLDYLIDGIPLYVTPEASLYTLKVAAAAQRSAETGQTITLE